MIKFEKIMERDIDFVIMRIFAENSPVMNLFLNEIGIDNANTDSVIHSLTDPQWGESDVTVIIKSGGKKYGILIEDKIDAIAMPNQHQRYIQRGDLGVKNHEYDSYYIFIVAPQKYLRDNDEAQKYPHRISFEELISPLQEAGSCFDAEIIKEALKEKEHTYVVHEVPHITMFWNKLHDYVWNSTHEAEMYPVKGAKGSRSQWFQFRVSVRGWALYFKADRGCVDLEFTGKLNQSIQIKEKLQAFIDDKMYWENAGKSLILRTRVQRVDVNKPFEEQIPQIETALNAVDALYHVAAQFDNLEKAQNAQ